jgi:hypothetical protein
MTRAKCLDLRLRVGSQGQYEAETQTRLRTTAEAPLKRRSSDAYLQGIEGRNNLRGGRRKWE